MIEPFCRYQAIVRLRRDERFTVKSEAETLDGSCVTVTTGWQFLEKEGTRRPEYEGEWAMMLDRDCDPGVGWIASGDLVDIISLSEDES